MNYFLKAYRPNEKTLYIKVVESLHLYLHDVFVDLNFTLKKIQPIDWDCNIEYGLSYEVLDDLELKEITKEYINTTQ